MKKLFLSMAVLLFVGTAFAQKDSKSSSGLRWGVKLGPSFASMAGEDADPSSGESKKMLLAYHMGVFAALQLNSMLYLQPEILFARQGVRYKEGDYKYSLSTNHINIPIALRIQSPSGFYAIVGPQVGFTLNGKEKWEYQGDEETDDAEDLRSVIFSGVIGAGYALPNGFGVYGRYARAFSSAYDYDDLKFYHSTLTLSFFYMWNMAKKK